ncbi:Multidrug transporter MdtC [Raoultella planticola]|uniref:Multidrug transporter MdtC n=1 Tax=Raoultella planticola TaxID=575 RepID=A0A485A8E9_RAOPL|nr:Multidrug transporter MdtC [Raoultella planticola]
MRLAAEERKPSEPTRNRGFGRLLVAVQGGYGKSLKWVLKHSRITGLVLLGTMALSVWLYISIPKTFFPEQDTGVLMGGIQADQSISFQAMRGKLQDFMQIIREDPAVDNVTGFTGGSRVNSGMMFINPPNLATSGMKRRSRLLTGCVKNWRKNQAPTCS